MLVNQETSAARTYHTIDYSKNGHRSLAEFAYRVNRRYELKRILPRLLFTAVETKPQPLSKLHLSEAAC
jgi:hypothetical protein